MCSFYVFVINQNKNVLMNDIDLCWNLSSLLRCTDCNTTTPSLHPHPVAARVGREQLFSACGWHVGVLKVRRGGRKALLFAQCSTQLPPHQLNKQPLPTNPTELSSPPAQQAPQEKREWKQSSPWITPNQGFLFSPAFWQTTAKKSL